MYIISDHFIQTIDFEFRGGMQSITNKLRNVYVYIFIYIYIYINPQ